ncbi:MAG: hypothetical protein Q9208_008724 [Pyrenodesmia sp. 3 TL-2023]
MEEMENTLVDQNEDILAALKTGPPFAVDIADFMGRQGKLFDVKRRRIDRGVEHPQDNLAEHVEELRYDQLKFVLDNINNLSDINKPRTDGLSPLHVALGASHFDQVELLLARGADQNVKPINGIASPFEELIGRIQFYLPMYELFEFDALAKNFPDETLTLFTFNEEGSSNPPISMKILGLQKGSRLSSESFWFGLGQKEMSDLFPLRVAGSKKEDMIELFPVRSADVIHLERTLDEAYYPGLSAEILKKRNEDQVVSRVFKGSRRVENHECLLILLVSQLWLWRLENFVVSASASSDTTATNKDFHNSTWTSAESIRSPNLLMGLIFASWIEGFGAQYENKDEGLNFPPTLNFFEMAVVSILSDLDEYMSTQVSVDVKKEAELIHVISDIRDELFMIQDVLN